MIVGHTHRVSNLMRGHILITEGINAGASYSVLQLMVKGGDVQWAGGATRVAKTIGVAARADVKAIVDDANTRTAVLRTKVIGKQVDDITRAPTRLFESEMGNLVADAMRAKYPGVDAAYTNSGGLRADLVFSPPSAGEQPGEITWGEVFAVLPFGNRSVDPDPHRRAAQGGVHQRVHARLRCDLRRAARAGSRRSPASRSSSTATARSPSSTSVWKAPDWRRRHADAGRRRRTPSDSSRTTSCSPAATATPSSPRAPNVAQPGDDLLQVTIDYITAHSPVDPQVDGRIVGP